MCYCLIKLNLTKSKFSTNCTKTDIPFCCLRPVCDRNNPMIHTLTVPAHGNTICDPQSKHKQAEVVTFLLPLSNTEYL